MDFTKYYEHVEFTPNKRLHVNMRAKQGDNGRGFRISVDGDASTLSLTVDYELPDGTKDNDVAIISNDEFLLQIPSEIFRQTGNVKVQFVLRSNAGDILAKDSFEIPVRASVREVS